MSKRRQRTGPTVPEGIDSIINRILAKKDAKTPFKNMRLLRKCEKRIGVDFARHLQAKGIANGVLSFMVDSPSWLQQYQFYSAEILRRVNTPPLDEPITGLRFSVGRIEGSAYLCEGSEQASAGDCAPSPEEIADLERSVAAVHPELRDDVRSLLTHWLAARGSRKDYES